MKKFLFVLLALVFLFVSCEEHVHSWDNGTVTTAATCTSEGVMTYKCSGCAETKTESIPKVASHSFETTWTKDENYHWHAASCGCAEKDSYAEHDWNGGVIDPQPTCSAEGVKTYTCTVCGKTKTEAVAKTEHTWGIGVIDKDTMTEAFECSVCGETKAEVVEDDVFAVTFVFNEYLYESSDTTIYYKSGETIGTRGLENGYEEYDIFDWWLYPVRYGIKVTSETVVNKDMKVCEMPNGGFVIFYDTEDNIVDVLGPYTFSTWHTIETSEFPEVPAIEGYQGYWMDAEEDLSEYFTKEFNKFYTVAHPWYISDATWETTGMPKSIIMTNGTRFWIHDKPVKSIYPIEFVDNSYTGKFKVGSSELQKMYSWFSSSEERDAFGRIPAEEKMSAWIEKMTSNNQSISIISSIINLRANSENKTWTLPFGSEPYYIWYAMYKKAQNYMNSLSGGAELMYFFSTGRFGKSEQTHDLIKVNTKTGGSNAVSSDGSSGGYLWLISYEPIE